MARVGRTRILLVGPGVVAIVLVLVQISAETAAAQLVGDPEHLKLAIAQFTANRDRLQTWRGEVRIADHRVEEGAGERHADSTVTFAYRRQPQAVRWYRVYHEEVQRIDGQEKRADDPGFLSGMVKERALYALERVHPKSHEGPYSVVITAPKRLRFGPTSDNFDPTFYFSAWGRDLAPRFGVYANDPSNPKLEKASVSRSGERIVLEIHPPDLLNRYEIDLAQGGNQVCYDGKDSSVETHWTFRYVERGGVWVPEEVTFDHVSLKQGVREKRHLRWVQNVVNEPLAEDELSLVKLGLRRGDVVEDSRAGTKFVVTGDEYPAPEPVEEPPPAGSRPARLWVVIASLGLLGLLFLLGWRARHQVRGKQSP